MDFDDDWYYFWYEEWKGNECLTSPPKRNKSRISMEERRRDEYSKKAWDYHMDLKNEEALHYIDLALDLNNDDSTNWYIKGLILEAMKRYEESQYCYDRSLDLSFDDVVCDSKARMLFDWAYELIKEARESLNKSEKLKEAKEINIRAINTLSGNSEEDIGKYLAQRDAINSYINQEKEYWRNLDTLKKYSTDELFTITGTYFYNKSTRLLPGLALKLVKEPDNEFDKNAIAVYAGDEKIGYVANRNDTKYELTSSASMLQDKFKNTADAIFLFTLKENWESWFLIGRLIK